MSVLTLNFTLQDILGATLASFLFPIVIVFPGYVSGWALNLFDFRLRQPIVKLGIGFMLSFAISPIVLDLTSSLFSLNVSLLTLGGFAAAFAVIILKEKTTATADTKRGAKTILWIGVFWVAPTILSLIELQWKDQLYFSSVSGDQTARVSVIEAMTRTGVPPINPSYYPGHPVQLTFLYYFWYILGSMIDVIGGNYVDALAALTASSAWSGLGLMAVVAFYLRLRNADKTESAWRSAKIGVLLLTVSGLDALPIIMTMARIGTIVGSVEVWNTQITTWIGTIFWTPHHIAALIAGLCAIMLAQSARGKTASRQFVILTVTGLGFASAFGLSVWVTLVFVAFWGFWLVALFIQKTERRLIAPMVFAGIVGILLASPFLIDMFRGDVAGTGQYPIVFEIRTLFMLESFVENWPPLARSLIMLAVLPINYLFELGFFFIAGIYWLKIKGKETIRSNPFYLTEILLLVVVLLIGSCLRSTLHTTNDLAWRSWLPGQFVLLIWGVDILESMVFISSSITIKTADAIKTRNLLLILISIGILTSTMDVVFLRITWPVMMEKKVSQSYYSARLAYDYLRDHIPADVITQNNPLDITDRACGMHGTHQMVISMRTAYGIPLDVFYKLAYDVSVLFTNKNVIDWQMTDKLCNQYSIDMLIIKDTDPVWSSLALLGTQRPALYKNAYYALFACGNYAQNKH
ncbi:MAG: hypothetical protein MUO77_17350 [Anaerolineales bacterium]|nr:hypothetical protein [Anaerolineales bacterium]